MPQLSALVACQLQKGHVTLAVIGLVYKAYPNDCRHKCTFLLRLRPYPVRGHWLLRGSAYYMLRVTLLLSLEPFSLFAHGTVKHYGYSLIVAQNAV